jgi:mannose-6-phosphate isomerase-like protein (cupin superfamily)
MGLFGVRSRFHRLNIADSDGTDDDPPASLVDADPLGVVQMAQGKVFHFFRIEQGEARFVFNSKEEHLVHDAEAVVVLAGTYNVINTSSTSALRLYTIYTPPQHPDGTVHKTKAEAEAAEHH